MIKPNNYLIAGVDEAGRGPLAGSVVAAAVILPDNHTIIGLADSKKLTAKKRNTLFFQIQQQAISYAISFVDEKKIDEINILQASLLAMKQAVLQLKITPDKVLIDGNQAPDLSIQTQTVIGGDALIECISAASILAKVARDKQITKQHNLYPEYGFDKHKGYPTKLHLEALKKYGICTIHRLSYKPVQRIVSQK